MPQTYIGELKTRTDIPALGQTKDGTYRVCLNFVPNALWGNYRPFGVYKYWKKRPLETSNREYHYWNHMSGRNEWEEAGLRHDNLLFPQMFQRGIEAVAADFDCNIWLEFHEEQIDPDDPEAVASWVNIHLYNLKEVTDLNNLVPAVAKRISREAKHWIQASRDWSIELV